MFHKKKNARQVVHKRRATVQTHADSITPFGLYVCAAIIGGLIGLVYTLATVYNVGFQDALRIVGAS